MTDPAKLAQEHGLTVDEFQRLGQHLGRLPSLTELGIVAAMWSEHCSYKSSRVHLARLPSTGERVVVGPGENAGAVDIGDGQVAVFKMESHNHPSFIEPYQGAATGVGGICRDIFAMGARPVALADCLRFGKPEHPRTSFLVSGVVAGIADYGNAFGVPTVAGDVAFDDSYNGNILVNVLCVGVAARSRIARATAGTPGNSIVYLGAKTGRDGIHGATMASAEFVADEASIKDHRPAVQVGDPFTEKLLLEACLELLACDCVIGIQDLGAAGLTSAAVEMAARAGSGADLDLDRVPAREIGMTPYELMLSESQERMLLAVAQGREQEVLAVADKWDLDAVRIGQVTDSGRLIVRMGGQVHADLPIQFLADGLVYERPCARPAEVSANAPETGPAVPGAADHVLDDVRDLGSAWLALLGAPTIASKSWVYGQYDHMVGHSTVVRPGAADAGVIRILPPGPDAADAIGTPTKGLAISAGCDSRYVHLDPRAGAALAVVENYANLVAVGARPLAVTNCLNFGNPEKPEIMWQLSEAVDGLADACRALDTPVVSGNVSLYNETDGQAIKPTPMVAMIGLLDDVARHLLMGFARPGDAIAVAGELAGSLVGSAYLAHLSKRTAGSLAVFDPARHKPVFAAVQALHARALLHSAHDISDGGLAVAVAESALAARAPMSVELAIGDHTGRIDELFFGEAPARFVVSLALDRIDDARQVAADLGAPFMVIGQTVEAGSAERATLRAAIGDRRVALSLADARRAYESGFAKVLSRGP